MVAFLWNCIDILVKTIPIFQGKKKNKAGKPPKIDIRHEQRLSEIPNSFKIRKLISHRNMLESWQTYLMFQIEL